MDKQTLLEKINKAAVSPELKTVLANMVNEAPVVDQTLMDKIAAAIDAEASNLIEEIANTELETQTDKYGKEMQEVDKDVSNFSTELNKKADEIDLADARSKVAGA